MFVKGAVVFMHTSTPYLQNFSTPESTSGIPVLTSSTMTLDENNSLGSRDDRSGGSSAFGSPSGVRFAGCADDSPDPSIDSGLQEWRRIRLEQDAAFDESLHIDQAKDQNTANQVRLEQVKYIYINPFTVISTYRRKK